MSRFITGCHVVYKICFPRATNLKCRKKLYKILTKTTYYSNYLVFRKIRYITYFYMDGEIAYTLLIFQRDCTKKIRYLTYFSKDITKYAKWRIQSKVFEVKSWTAQDFWGEEDLEYFFMIFISVYYQNNIQGGQ